MCSMQDKIVWNIPDGKLFPTYTVSVDRGVNVFFKYIATTHALGLIHMMLSFNLHIIMAGCPRLGL